VANFADDVEEHLMPSVHVSARSFPLLFTSVHNRLQTRTRGIAVNTNYRHALLRVHPPDVLRLGCQQHGN
jgi:hypothetical protein